MTLADIDISTFDTILLDRDGTINRRRPDDYVRSAAQLELIEGVGEALARWTSLGKRLIVVTNQRGVGLGLMGLDELRAVHDEMRHRLAKFGARIDAIYYATSRYYNDDMRKPSAGMWREIQRDFPQVDASTTVMIGDSDCDELFARNCGIEFRHVDCVNIEG